VAEPRTVPVASVVGPPLRQIHRRRARGNRTAATRCGATVSGDRGRTADRLAPSAGGLARQPLLGAARTGYGPGHGQPPGRWRVRRHCHQQRDRHRPARTDRRRPGRHRPRRRARHRPWRGGHGRSQYRPPASAQGTHPPGPEARAAATELRERLAAGNRAVIESPITTTNSTVIDLSAYERAAQQRSIPKRPPPTPP
jgi:hypothetical protein